MATATGKIAGSALLEIGEDTTDAANVQSYGLTKEMSITGTSNTVLQIRLDLDDYTLNGDIPKLAIALGYASGTFTVVAATNVITTSVNHGRAIGDEIEFSSDTTLPTPLVVPSPGAGTYYVLTVPAANTMTVSATKGGAVVDISDTGTGIHSFKSYATDSGVEVTELAYLGGVGEPDFPDVSIKDQRSGGRDSFETIKGLAVAIFATDGTAAASGHIIIEGGDSSKPDSYFVFSLKLDAAASSGHSSFAVFALPEGWAYQDDDNLIVTIRGADNLSCLINLLGH